MRITPESFLSQQENAVMPPRIGGSECEYNVQFPPGLVDEAQREYFGQSALHKAGIAHHGQYLGTVGGGGRLYPDVNRLGEYASADANGPAAQAVADEVGMEAFCDIVNATGLPQKGIYRQAGLFSHKSRHVSTIGRNKTAGYHRNIAIPNSIRNDALIQRLIPTILTTSIYAMSGTLKDDQYVLSQKIWDIGDPPINYEKTRRTTAELKPMMTIHSSRDDADVMEDKGYARAEARLADPVLGLIGKFAGNAALSLAFRLVEQQDRLGTKHIRSFCLLDPVKSGKAIAADTTFQKTFPVYGLDDEPTEMSALSIQDAFINSIEELNKLVELPDDERFAIWVIKKLNDACRRTNLQENMYDDFARDTIECIARHRFLLRDKSTRKLYDPQSLTADNDMYMQRNILWNRVSPIGPGVAYMTRTRDRNPEVAVIEDQIYAYAITNGLSARARKRLAMIDSGQTKRTVKDWTHYAQDYQMYSFGPLYDDIL